MNCSISCNSISLEAFQRRIKLISGIKQYFYGMKNHLARLLSKMKNNLKENLKMQ